MLLEKMTFNALMWPLPAPLAPPRPNLTQRIQIKPNRGQRGRGTSHTMELNYSTQLGTAVCSARIHTTTAIQELWQESQEAIEFLMHKIFYIKYFFVPINTEKDIWKSACLQYNQTVLGPHCLP